MMVVCDLIKAHSRYLAALHEEGNFVKECLHLMDSLKDNVGGSFGSEIKSRSLANNWGRLGVECKLYRQPLGQWLSFGVYVDPSNFGIEFKLPFEPEFAVFLDISPEHRAHLARARRIAETISELKNQGFEFNFPANLCRNSWRLCYWRDSMRNFATADQAGLKEMFEERLEVLFASSFYRTARDM
jgi:hypothetical protein